VNQVMGFPCDDGKQQLILAGIISASSLCACLTCMCERSKFGVIPSRLWKLKQRIQGVQGPAPQDAPLRVGDNDLVQCSARMKDQTLDGKIVHTADYMRALKLQNGSVNKDPLRPTHPMKCFTEPCHGSSGLANHGNAEMRKEIRELEDDQPFMVNARRIKEEVEDLLNQLTISAPKDADVVPLLLPLHEESKKLRKVVTKHRKKVTALEIRMKKKKNSQDMGELNEGEKNRLEKEIEKIEKQIDTHRTAANEAWEKVKDHSESSDYGHLCQLEIGLSELLKALTKFLAEKSKRPRGPLEYIFTKAVELLGGGRCMAENGGFDQTNGRALVTLQNFDTIVDVCLTAYDLESPTNDWRVWQWRGTVKSKFNLWREWAKHAYALLTCLKSQKTLSSDEVGILLLNVLDAWDAAFPGVPCFNKLHWIMGHILEFIDKYGIYGRLSAESHESVHARLSRVNGAVKRMTSTEQRFRTFHARASVNLKDGILENKAICEKKMSGNKRGKYNTSKNKSKRQDGISSNESHFFRGTITVDNKEYLLLLGGGRLPIEYKELYLYVCTGRSPEEWVRGFAATNLLSKAKIEEARQAVH